MAKNDKMEAQKEAKLKALDDAIAHIEKQYGKGSVMKLGDPRLQKAQESSLPGIGCANTGRCSADLKRNAEDEGSDL